MFVIIELDCSNASHKVLVVWRRFSFGQYRFSSRNLLLQSSNFVLQVNDIASRNGFLFRRIEELTVGATSLARTTIRQPRITARFSTPASCASCQRVIQAWSSATGFTISIPVFAWALPRGVVVPAAGLVSCRPSCSRWSTSGPLSCTVLIGRFHWEFMDIVCQSEDSS